MKHDTVSFDSTIRRECPECGQYDDLAVRVTAWLYPGLPRTADRPADPPECDIVTAIDAKGQDWAGRIDATGYKRLSNEAWAEHDAIVNPEV